MIKPDFSPVPQRSCVKMSSVGTCICAEPMALLCVVYLIEWTEVHPYKMNRASGSEEVPTAIAKSSVGTIDVITPEFSPVPQREAGRNEFRRNGAYVPSLGLSCVWYILLYGLKSILTKCIEPPALKYFRWQLQRVP